MDVKVGILILLNMAPPQILVLAPSAIFRGNTVHVFYGEVFDRYLTSIPANVPCEKYRIAFCMNTFPQR